MERIKVSADGWNFEGVETGARMVPFGANFVFNYGEDKRSLDIMTTRDWEPDVIRKAFEVAAECNMNLMKVFLPIPALLPDPQENESVRFTDMTPSIWERLDFLFDVARETGVYITLSLAEWGMGGSQWFHDGGEFFGSSQADAKDSFRVFRNLWVELAKHLEDEPALFSYNLAVELFVPSGNWGGERKSMNYLFADRWALGAWRRWLLGQYGGLAGINAAWGTSFNSIEEIQQPEIRWLPAKKSYTVSQEIIADYITFKECAVYLFPEEPDRRDPFGRPGSHDRVRVSSLPARRGSDGVCVADGHDRSERPGHVRLPNGASLHANPLSDLPSDDLFKLRRTAHAVHGR